jgi:hypothetical protein
MSVESSACNVRNAQSSIKAVDELISFVVAQSCTTFSYASELKIVNLWKRLKNEEDLAT